MQSQLSTPAQRAQHRIAGLQPVDILVEAVADQDYVLMASVTGFFQVSSVAALTSAGTVSLAVKRIRSGVTVTVGGLSALAVSSVRASASATGDNTSLFQPGDTLLITTSANAGGVDLGVTVSVLPMGVGV